MPDAEAAYQREELGIDGDCRAGGASLQTSRFRLKLPRRPLVDVVPQAEMLLRQPVAHAVSAMHQLVLQPEAAVMVL